MSCIICKNPLDDYKVIYNKVRGTNNKKCIVVMCKKCTHTQLINYELDLKEHYENDNQDNEIKLFSNKTNKEIEDAYFNVNTKRVKRIENYNISINKNSKIIDIGSGLLYFPKLMKDKYKCNVESIELSTARINKGLSILDISKNYFKIHNCLLDKEFAEKNKNNYDLVTIWHVLEHVENVYEMVNDAFQILKPGGTLIIETPNEDDYLLQFDNYKSIMYQIHHLSYFTNVIFEKICNDLNITNYKIKYYHRYDIKNFIGLILNNPQKSSAGSNGTIDDELKDFWHKSLENIKGTDSIYLIIKK